MKAHIIENGKVTNTIEIATLTTIPRLSLIDASLGGVVGDLWDGSVFSKPIPTAAELEAIKLAFNATVHAQLAAADLTIVRALVENDAPRIAAFKVTQTALRATLKP